MSVIPIIDVTLCDGCGLCLEACQAHAVELVGGKAVVVKPQDCDYCTDCESHCPQDAVSCPLELVVLERPNR